MQSLTLIRPDDWHLHLRDGAGMASVVEETARCFGRAIVMPNLRPPVITVEQALAYRQRILAALPTDTTFRPLMTLYLTDNTKPEEIIRLAATASVVAVKYYPAGATTNSENGVTDLRHVWSVLEAMQIHQIPLLVHGEVTADSVDIFDRESVFIEQVLDPMLTDFPALRVVLEHITTGDAVSFVLMQDDRLAATVTAHHLLMSRNAIFNGGVRPHHYCLPVLKRDIHRQALVQAVTSGNPKFFLGTDSAPHPRIAKESACGCAGMYTAPAAIELYAEVFEAAGALDRLEGFASRYGAEFYGLSPNSDTITLVRQAWQMSAECTFGDSTVVPLRAGEMIQWRQAYTKNE